MYRKSLTEQLAEHEEGRELNRLLRETEEGGRALEREKVEPALRAALIVVQELHFGTVPYPLRGKIEALAAELRKLGMLEEE